MTIIGGLDKQQQYHMSVEILFCHL